MVVVIDGYNLLRAIFPKVKGKLDKQRRQLIKQLGYYKKRREGKIKDIVVVFDGGRLGRATREIRGGVVVVFAGHKRSADDWIVDFVDRKKDRELMLVTRDRELIEKCRKLNSSIEVIRGVDFYKIMQERLLEEVGEDLERDADEGGVKKYKRDEVASEALDLLMEQAPLDLYEKVDEVDVGDEKSRKKGKERKASKKEKKRSSKLRKL